MKKLLESPHGELALALFGVCVAPLAEELAFRGFLQPLLVRTLGTGAGIVLTALFFGLLHGPENGWSWGHVALISLAGAAFGAIRYFGSTRSSILAHAAYNGTLFAALFAQGRNPAI